MQKDMTIQELYDWAKENKVENCKIAIQYRDDGGDYYGVDDYVELRIKDNKVIL